MRVTLRQKLNNLVNQLSDKLQFSEVVENYIEKIKSGDIEVINELLSSNYECDLCGSWKIDPVIIKEIFKHITINEILEIIEKIELPKYVEITEVGFGYFSTKIIQKRDICKDSLYYEYNELNKKYELKGNMKRNHWNLPMTRINSIEDFI